MYCKLCGAVISETAYYCPRCGGMIHKKNRHLQIKTAAKFLTWIIISIFLLFGSAYISFSLMKEKLTPEEQMTDINAAEQNHSPVPTAAE